MSPTSTGTESLCCSTRLFARLQHLLGLASLSSPKDTNKHPLFSTHNKVHWNRFSAVRSSLTRLHCAAFPCSLSISHRTYLFLWQQVTRRDCMHHGFFALPRAQKSIQRLAWKPLVFPRTGVISLPASEKIEEETIPGYVATRYYPVRIGQIFRNRYQVVGKLGYGITSTVWLARDIE